MGKNNFVRRLFFMSFFKKGNDASQVLFFAAATILAFLLLTGKEIVSAATPMVTGGRQSFRNSVGSSQHVEIIQHICNFISHSLTKRRSFHSKKVAFDRVFAGFIEI